MKMLTLFFSLAITGIILVRCQKIKVFLEKEFLARNCFNPGLYSIPYYLNLDLNVYISYLVIVYTALSYSIQYSFQLLLLAD